MDGLYKFLLYNVMDPMAAPAYLAAVLLVVAVGGWCLVTAVASGEPARRRAAQTALLSLIVPGVVIVVAAWPMFAWALGHQAADPPPERVLFGFLLGTLTLASAIASPLMAWRWSIAR